MVFMTIVFMFPTAPHATSLTMNWTAVCLGGWIFISLVSYYFPFYGGVYWFKGPVAKVDGHDLKCEQLRSVESLTLEKGSDPEN
jgi:hypothetical protein